MKRRVSLVLALGTAAAALLLLAPGAGAQSPACENRNNNTIDKLLECVTLDGVREHQAALQDIADANDGVRVSGRPGYDASVEYVADKARAAGYRVTVQEFPFVFFVTLVEEAREVSPTARDLEPNTMTYSPPTPAGGITAPVAVVPEDADTGCTASDFASQPYAGTIAFIRRGGCTFAIKAANAAAAGAVAAVIVNNAPGPIAGTLSSPENATIPTVGVSPELGDPVIADAAAGPTTVFLNIETIQEDSVSYNVLAETRRGNPNNVVVVGAHLDSVFEGPGINDNGSGSAAVLEVAEQMTKVKPRNKVRFAWWGAEEFGLVGSNHYVADLSQAERDDIALYLNFDMIGSPNYVRFIYDGDGSAFGLAGPAGSAAIETLYEDFYDARGLAHDPTEISFRSDYAAFFDAGIPFGGLFTGAEGIKTPAQQAIYGGTAGQQYDPCYHAACDTFGNVALDVLHLNSDAVAFSTLTYAMSTRSVNGEGR
jgi:Zn-dependent M28 family amino/carboxypeptidase